MMEYGKRHHTPWGIQRGSVSLVFLVHVILMIPSTFSQSGTTVGDSSTGGSPCPTISQVFNSCAQTSLRDTCLLPSPPRDCKEVNDAGFQQSGRYEVTPDDGEGPFFVFCDLETSGGGWTLIQRRENGFVDFYRHWSDYKHGFGLVVGEHWLGNEKIHRLTSQKRYVLRVEVSDWEGGVAYAEYDLFIILGEESQYQLIVGDYRGTAGDSLGIHNGHPFTTRDADNDEYASNCAVSFHGAWWYTACHNSNLNGQYYGRDEISNDQARGISWYSWKDQHHYTLMKTEMKIRPSAA